MRQLEIGPGDGPAKGGQWDTLTANQLRPATHHTRWGYEALPIADNTYDLVYASHVIEHIPWYRIHSALKEVHRILRPNGTIEIWTVNFDKVVQAYIRAEIPDQWRRYNPEGDLMKWINGRIFAYSKTDESDEDLNIHRACFTSQSLINQLLAAGFHLCHPLGKPRGEDHGDINLGIGATK